MWRKPTDAKPSESKAPSQQPKAPVTPVAPAPVAPVVAATPAPAVTAAPPTPVYAAPAPKAEMPKATPPKAAPREVPGGTSIGAGLKIRGEVTGSSDLFIDGDVQGKINLTDARVTVGVNGHIQADIEARDIVIDGTVDGNLKARESVRLGASSKVQGSILTPRIGIDDGARLRGKVEMTRGGEAKSSKPSGSSASGTTEEAIPAYNAVSASIERE